MCKKLVGKKWGLKPKLFHWLYTAVVRPIVSYGCHVWWPVIDIEKYSNMVAKVNRIAALSISGAMNSTSTSALEIILDIMPLDLYIKQTATITLTRLQQTGTLQRRPVRHMSLIENLNVSTDDIISKNNIGSSFKLVIPSTEDWKENKVERADVNIYTDGSKSEIGTGSGFHIEALDLNDFYRLDDDCSIFQAEIYAIFKAAQIISMLPIYQCDIGFYIDSQAALKALSSSIVRSNLVLRCLRELKALSGQHNITLYWVPGHNGILGNEKADALAKEGAKLTSERAVQDVYPPMSLIKHRTKQSMKVKWHDRWERHNSCNQTKQLWDKGSSRNNAILLEMDRRQIRMVVNLITGHNTLGKHMVKIGVSNDDTCRWCLDAVEDSRHILCVCPALAFRRYSVFDSYSFQNLVELNGVNPWKLLSFIQASRWNA